MEGRRRGKGRPKWCLVESLRNDMAEFDLSSLLALEGATWKKMIHVANLK